MRTPWAEVCKLENNGYPWIGYERVKKDYSATEDNPLQTDRDITKFIETQRKEFYDEWFLYTAEDYE